MRRGIEQRIDQAWALTRKRLAPPSSVPPFDGDARFAIVTVNFSTTRYLKLMLLTLSEQTALERVRRIVVVDNASRDGGAKFVRALASSVPRISVVENRLWLSHARGVRAGLRKLDTIDAESNVVMFLDTDVVFRDPTTLERLTTLFTRGNAAAAGELRHGLYPYPEAQASFLLVRRDVLGRADVAPWVDHGAPSYWLQRSLWRAGLNIADFPSNQGGYVLHRGRSGVAAAARYRPRGSYASTPGNPHFMGVPNGPAIWAEIETRWGRLLEDEAELLAHLGRCFHGVGSST